MLLIVVEYLVLAATFTLAKKTLSYAPFLFLLTVRFSVAALLLVGAAQLRNLVKWRQVWCDRWLFLLAGFLHAYAAFVLEFWALQYTSSAKTALIYATTPFIAALLSFVMYRERLSVLQWSGMLISGIGLLPLFVQGDFGGLGSLGNIHLADGVLLLAVASAAAAWFVIKGLMNRGHHLVMVNGVAMGIGAVLCGVTMAIVSPGDYALVQDWTALLGWLSALIVLSHVVSYNLYSWLLTKHSITFMTLCGFLCPLFSAALGALFLGEPIGWAYAVGVVGLVLGLFLFTGKSKNTRREPPLA